MIKPRFRTGVLQFILISHSFIIDGIRVEMMYLCINSDSVLFVFILNELDGYRCFISSRVLFSLFITDGNLSMQSVSL